MHFGIISPPVSGHLHPFGALGRELIARGHKVTLLHMPDLAARAEAEGLNFIPLGESDHPRGSLSESLAKLGQLDGLAALRFTIQAICKTANMFCRDAPAAIRRSGIDVLLVDQTEPEGGSIAEHIGLPFITICNALALNREPTVPPPFTGWTYGTGPWFTIRNRFGYLAYDQIMRPLAGTISRYRKQWKLSPYLNAEATYSPWMQISQQPPAFDFPRRRLSPQFHYVGPLRRAPLNPISFPWEKLDGRPLVYASLGTLQNGKERVFRCFAQACSKLDVQLVITHGGGLDEKTASSFPGNPLVVSYAPQLDVLARASLTLTHAGLNTVLDSLSHGVPLVAVPITYEQPAIASRIRWAGVGEVFSFKALQPDRLMATIKTVLADSSYALNARKVGDSIRQAGGICTAVDLIEGLKI